nr:hypothetical protein [uncultured Rhodopila sp.]
MRFSDRKKNGTYVGNGEDHRDSGRFSDAPTIHEGKYMYVPPFDPLLEAIGTTRAEFETSTHVTIPAELFRLLLQVTVANSDFNEEAYLKANPDVADVVRAGSPGDARIHYVGYGYFEGRSGATPDVDESWYLHTYSDVAEGIKEGKTTSAAAHFEVIGAAEGRSPSARYVAAAEQWKQALKPPRET